MTGFDASSGGSTSSDASTTNYAQVRFKELEGTLVLTREQMALMPSPSLQSTPSWSTPWLQVAKHQVSPVTYPKCLLKVIFNNGNGNATFQLANRAELERIRRDVTGRLQYARTTENSSSNIGSNGTSDNNNNNNNINSMAAPSRKRPHSQVSQQVGASLTMPGFGDLDATALAVTRSSLLAANPTLRAQHRYLVEETETVSEDDFWKTHQDLLEEEYARIAGTLKAGMSSLLQSHLPLQGRVTLGVEEMRQIFILYPAVHKAYEEQVPFKLSDEQFWRNYLASQFVHRDRGRLGTAARHHSSTSSQEAADKKEKANAKAGGNTLSVEEQEARAAAIGTDDLFSRYDQKLREASADGAAGTATTTTSSNVSNGYGNRLAVGQFDLVSTFSTERGDLLQGPRDYHPPNPILNDDDEGKGSRVIQKYNRHWAMVLHPDEAVAGSNLMEVARLSVLEDADNNVEDAKPGGGVHQEMQRLIELVAAADAGGSDYNNDGDDDDALTLKNVEAYYTGRFLEKKDPQVNPEEVRQRHAVFSQRVAAKMRDLAAPIRKNMNAAAAGVGAGGGGGGGTTNHGFGSEECFPAPNLGRELLAALTNKMSQDSKTEAETQDVVNSLPEDFLKRLQAYFRRSSELLRHFFGLRQLPEHANSEKMARIVSGMETVYREVEGMRKELPQSEMGEMMRKMCLPIMDQLDNAFKLRREGSGVSTGRSGGFVTVEEL